MIYPIDLRAAGLIAGALLLITHLVAVTQPEGCRKFLTAFPRSRLAGTVLIAVATLWSFLLVSSMDLGEFAGLRRMMQVATLVSGILAWTYVEEFLAVRALGMLALLAAEPLLEGAFLRPESSRLLLVVVAYVWIIGGLFLVGMPWLLRDGIAWLNARRERYSAAAWGGVVYGAALVLCAFALWK